MDHLPQFLVIGAGKSGTTSIHEYLRQHPQISLPIRKETHFFICNKQTTPIPPVYFGRTIENYIDNLEDYKQEFEVKPNASIFGEVCPSYLFYPTAAQNIKSYLPDARIICILRNPVDRFYSNFNYRDNKFGTSKQNVERNNLSQFEEIIESILTNTASLNTKRTLENGYYSRHLSRYYSLFPKANIKVFLFEDLQRQPRKMMNDLMSFIGLPPYPFDVDMKFNVSGKLRFKWLYRKIRKSKPAKFLRRNLPTKLYQKIRNITEKVILGQADPISPKNRKVLQELYRQDILVLQQMIDRDLSEWLK